MSYQDSHQQQQQATYSNSPEDSSQLNDDKKSAPGKHRRNYQACGPCRERKVKCDLGDVDNPRGPPCRKCAREQKNCWFSDTRKKNASKEETPPAKKQRTGSMNSQRSFPLPASPALGTMFGPPSSARRSPSVSFPPTTPTSLSAQPSSNMYHSQPPRSTPTTYPRSNGYDTGKNNMQSLYNTTASARTAMTGDDHVVMPKANTLAESFTNTTDGMNVLVRAATASEGMTTAEQLNRNRGRTLTGSTGNASIDKARMKSLELWNKMRLVRAGWFTAQEALNYIEFFYSSLAPMTPVVTEYFRNPANHRELLAEEPVLTLTILAITSRYCPLQSASALSRGYYIHVQMWDSLRKIIQRLLWGQEQFGGGFTGAGNVGTQQSASGQITWKGSLRTLGTVEALLLLTDWQPRALHFPPGDDENNIIGGSPSLIEEDRPMDEEAGNLPFSSWLEPAWRSDRMSWMLLGLAQSLAFELGVFDLRHEHCHNDHGAKSDCMRRRRIRRMIITYVSQISGRMGIQASLSPEQDNDPAGPNAGESIDLMQALWFDIARVMYDANNHIFPSRESTAILIENGDYKTLIAEFQPRLKAWFKKFEETKQKGHLHDAMTAVLRMEYEYARLYINSLGLQKVVGHMAQQNRETLSRGLSQELGKVIDENKGYIDEVRDAARKILEASCYGLGALKSNALGLSPVRTFLRTMSALMFSLKLLSLGNKERDVRSVFKLLREMTKRMSNQVVDDVHLGPHTAKLVLRLMADVHNSMVRIPPKHDGSRGQSRHISPQPNDMNVAYGSDQESPDPLGNIQFADMINHTFMPPPNFNDYASGTFSPNNNGINFDSNGLDPSLSGFPADDWISMPIDAIIGMTDSTVQSGWGGIGPTIGDRDMLSLITGNSLDQPESTTNGAGMTGNFGSMNGNGNNMYPNYNSGY